MNLQQQSPFTGATASAGLAAGTTTTLTSARAISYGIKSKGYYKAAASNEATPTVDSATGATFAAIAVGYGATVVFCRDAAGALKAVQSAQEPLDAAGAFKSAPQFPGVPDTLAPIGYVTVKVGSTGAAWTLGASNLAGPPTGVTFAFQDLVGGMPDRPQTA